MDKARNFVSFGRKIVAIGRNYREHAEELGNAVPEEPIIFTKPTSSYLEVGNNIKLPPGTTELDYEVELGVIIGQSISRTQPDHSKSSIAGYCLALDMTDRKLQKKLKSKGLPWTLSKGFDTACPVSKFIGLEELPDPHHVDIWLKVNGKIKQNGSTKDMIFPIPKLIDYIRQYISLEPGDLILTGTPSGVGPVQAGDVIQCGLADIVEMQFKVES